MASSIGVFNDTLQRRADYAVQIQFSAPSTTAIPAGTFVAGEWYQIATIGTTNFTAIGADANKVETIFIATGAGTGSGTAFPVVPINLTGWTAQMQVWNKQRTTKYADAAVTYVDRVNGTVGMALSYVDTATFPAEVYHDVLLINPSGIREYYLEGIFYVSEGYTA